jgi:hypothetical protein
MVDNLDGVSLQADHPRWLNPSIDWLTVSAQNSAPRLVRSLGTFAGEEAVFAAGGFLM